MNKVVDVLWFSGLAGNIGIVLNDNGFEKKAYIKQVAGFDEEADTQDILQNGAKIHLFQAEALVKHLRG